MRVCKVLGTNKFDQDTWADVEVLKREYRVDIVLSMLFQRRTM